MDQPVPPGHDQPRREHLPTGQRVAAGWATAGLLTTLMGFGGISSTHGLRDNGATTTATVVEVLKSSKMTTYDLRYTLEDGSIVTCSTEDVTGDPVVGDIVISYERNNPATNCQSTDQRLDMTESVALTAAGGIITAAALGRLVVLRTRLHQNRATETGGL